MRAHINFIFMRASVIPGDAPMVETQLHPANYDWKTLKQAGPGFVRAIRREWPKYTSVGCYPLFYVTKDNGVLCPECANRNLRLTLGYDPQWKITDCDINYEDNSLYCDNCSGRIESAYGEE